MRKRARFGMGMVLGVLALGWSAAFGQTFNSGSTGADGPFAPTASTTLALPAGGVFNFTTINIPSGVTVTFTRNAANTPVTLLASGNVTIAGIIDLNGTAGGNAAGATTRLGSNRGIGGSGGFDGGDGANGIASTTAGSGLGPGGGGGGAVNARGGGAGFLNPGITDPGAGAGVGGPVYGTPNLLPLIGGSGGGGEGKNFGGSGAGGGGGGGALLIASSGTITLTGTIKAQGGSGGSDATTIYGGGGSGGAVHLVATTLTGTGGTIDVRGGAFGGGSPGRVRLEAFTNTATVSFTAGMLPSVAPPTTVTLPNAPTLRIASVAGVAAPASPAASFSNPDIILPAGTASPVTVNLEASNIPLGTTMTVKVTGQTGAATSATSTGLSGTVASSTASATVAIPTNQPSVISAWATFTLVALERFPKSFYAGEEVTHVRVAATYGGSSRVSYLTASGREVPPGEIVGWLLGWPE